MKNMVIKWVLESVINALIEALKKLSTQTSNSIDDRLVATLEANKDDIIKEIKDKL